MIIQRVFGSAIKQRPRLPFVLVASLVTMGSSVSLTLLHPDIKGGSSHGLFDLILKIKPIHSHHGANNAELNGFH